MLERGCGKRLRSSNSSSRHNHCKTCSWARFFRTVGAHVPECLNSSTMKRGRSSIRSSSRQKSMKPGTPEPCKSPPRGLSHYRHLQTWGKGHNHERNVEFSPLQHPEGQRRLDLRFRYSKWLSPFSMDVAVFNGWLDVRSE